MAYIMKYNKKFVIVGSMNALNYKETTKLIVEKKIWFGNNNLKEFNNSDKSKTKFGNINWYTNLDYSLENRKLFLSKSYKKEPDLYKKADNMDVLVINKTKDIPYDYEYAMAVPISFMNKYNPNQFEILCDSRYYHKGWDKACDLILDGKITFRKLIIKNKHPEMNENNDNWRI